MSGSGFRFLQSNRIDQVWTAESRKCIRQAAGDIFDWPKWVLLRLDVETFPLWEKLKNSIEVFLEVNIDFWNFQRKKREETKPNWTRCFQRCKAALAAAEKASWKRATLLSRESPWNWSVSDPHFLFMLGLLGAKGQKKRCAEAHQNIMLPRLPKYSSGRTQCIRKGINNISFDESQAHQTHDVRNQRFWL